MHKLACPKCSSSDSILQYRTWNATMSEEYYFDVETQDFTATDNEVKVYDEFIEDEKKNRAYECGDCEFFTYDVEDFKKIEVKVQ